MMFCQLMLELWGLRFGASRIETSTIYSAESEFADSATGKFRDFCWISAVGATEMITRNGARIRVMRSSRTRGPCGWKMRENYGRADDGVGDPRPTESRSGFSLTSGERKMAG